MSNFTGKFPGKITKVSLGYYDGRTKFGLYTEMSGQFGVVTFLGYAAEGKSNNADELQTSKHEVMDRIEELLRDSKRESVEQLAGCPVEVTCEGGVVRSWRIFTEVL